MSPAAPSPLLTSSEPTEAAKDKQYFPAGLSSRFLAAFVDLLLIQALLIPLSTALPDADYLLLIVLPLCVLYYGVGNSFITSGRTLGKRAFGLRVVDIHSGQLLALSRSFYRSIFHTAIALCLIEIPPLVFRANATIAPASVLDIPMLLVLCYSLWNFTLPLISLDRRAGHDLFTGTLVVQERERNDDALVTAPEAPVETQAARPQFSFPRFLTHLAASLIIGSILWWFSISNSANVEAIHRIRYSLEHRFPIRIVAMQSTNSIVLMQLLLRAPESRALDTATDVCKTIQEEVRFPTPLEELRIELYFSQRANNNAGSASVTHTFNTNCEVAPIAHAALSSREKSAAQHLL